MPAPRGKGKRNGVVPPIQPVERRTATRQIRYTYYVHFQRKQDVLLELGDAAEALDFLGNRLAKIMSEMPRHITGRMVREIVGHREHWTRVLGNRRTLGAIIEPVIQTGQAAGVMRTDQTAARLAQALVILWLDNIIGWAERTVDLPLRQALAKATTLFLDGARR